MGIADLIISNFYLIIFCRKLRMLLIRQQMLCLGTKRKKQQLWEMLINLENMMMPILKVNLYQCSLYSNILCTTCTFCFFVIIYCFIVLFEEINCSVMKQSWFKKGLLMWTMLKISILGSKSLLTLHNYYNFDTLNRSWV